LFDYRKVVAVISAMTEEQSEVGVATAAAAVRLDKDITNEEV
jgi:hypothetical protein